MFLTFRQLLKACLVVLITNLETKVKQWTQPDMDSLIKGIVTDLNRSRTDLIAENAFLRQQLTILKRQTHRPSLTPRDRG